MRILKIKQAEYALADGRLDEACELADDSFVRGHARGQRLIGRLVEALLGRARKHLSAGQAQPALLDCDKAKSLGGNLAEVAAIRAEAAGAVAGHHKSRRRRVDLVAAAQRHVEEGRLSVGEEMLADLTDDSAAGDLRRQAAARRAAGEAALSRAESAAKQRNWSEAIDALQAAEAQHPQGGHLAEVKAHVVSAAAAEVRKNILRGRPDLAGLLLPCLLPLAGDQSDVADAARALEECRAAWEHIRRDRLSEAREALRRVEKMLPEAKWLKGAIEQVARAAEAMESLRAGPLGMMRPAPTAKTIVPEQSDPHEWETVADDPIVAAGGSAAELPPRVQLHVDGSGGVLVLRAARVTIGPVSGPEPPDVGLLADPQLPVVTIERIEGDYFLRSRTPVTVGAKVVTNTLLADGDRIALSPRCYLRFSLPHAASTTAVLNLAGARLPQADTRRVILMDREIVLGRGAAAHIRNGLLSGQAVLQVKDDRLLCRTELPLTVNRRSAQSPAAVPLDVPVRVGPVGLVAVGAE